MRVCGVLTALWLVAAVGCAADSVSASTKPGELGPTAPAADQFPSEPEVRVRIVRGAQSVKVSSAGGGFRLSASTGQPATMRGELTFTRRSGAWVFRGPGVAAMRHAGPWIKVEPADARPVQLDGNAYPGTLLLIAARRNAQPTDRIDVVNTVDMEAYLPGVLQRELYPSWEPAAFRAQAVAARSYALWEIDRSRRKGKAWDLESTTASQAYVGVTTASKPRDAVRATRGQVLVFEGRFVPAFYSSAHGGLSADGHLTFPDRSPDMAPLRGRRQGTWDQISNRHRWSATRENTDLVRRVNAWGKRNDHPIAGLQAPIRNITVAQTNAGGRHQAYFVDDGAGLRYTIRADQLRHAANTDAPGSPKAGKDNTLYSGHFTPALHGNTVHFLDGHGYGHGVGLSQWGAQGMAKAGNDHAAILRFYYPSAEIKAIYR